MAEAAVQTAVISEERARPWPLALRVAFRFAFCYWLFFWTWPASLIPGAQFLVSLYEKVWQAVCPWAAIHIFNLSGERTTYFQTGSGDTTLNYIEFLIWLVISIAATLIWSILDRRRSEYRTLHGWLRLLVRYALAVVLLSYGMSKVFPVQFQPASVFRLMQPFGEFSPMGVLWNFMGASQPYTMFSGAAEMAGGLLLLFRRTTTLGAMVSFAVMLNVAVLNFCYDVPVKLHSTHYVLMSVFLLAPEFRRLFAVLVLNRAASPADLPDPRFQRRGWRMTANILRVLFVGIFLLASAVSSWKRYAEVYIHPVRPPLYGLYRVESGAPAGWSKVAFAEQGRCAVRMVNNDLAYFQADYNAEKSTVALNGRAGNASLSWRRPDPAHLVLSGKVTGADVTIHLVKSDAESLLLHRGFHWIQEYPFNR